METGIDCVTGGSCLTFEVVVGILEEVGEAAGGGFDWGSSGSGDSNFTREALSSELSVGTANSSTLR